MATVAFYGPNDTRASKVAVAIIRDESDEVVDLQRWFSKTEDVRSDPIIGSEIQEFLQSHGVRSVVMTDGLIVRIPFIAIARSRAW